VAAQLLWIAPARSADVQVVHIRVYVYNAQDGTAVPAATVYFRELGGGKCGFSTGAATGADGIANFSGFIACQGAAIIEVIGGQFFKTGREEFQIVGGQSGYNLELGLEPKAQRPSLHTNKYIDQKERTLHIRVQGRLANGKLVPVHYATVYDRNDRHIATTDYAGHATARVKEVMGETVTLRAEGSHWRDATSSFIVGASEGGTRLTRNDDYVNFVLNGTGEAQAEDLELAVRVRGLKNGKHVTVHFASIYDAQGHHLGTTNYAGAATVHVKAPLGESFVVKVDATHWKPATETVIAGTAGGAGQTSAYSHVDFLLQPDVAGAKLTVEVLDRESDKPIQSASVTLYKPTAFPGVRIAHGTTNHKGEVTFDAEETESALLNGEARVGASHGGSEPQVQTIAGSLLTGEAPRYVIYLKEKKEITRWSGVWYYGPYTMNVSGGTGSLGFTVVRIDDAGTPYVKTYKSSGSCTVKGNEATCKWSAHYNDLSKVVESAGHGTFTFIRGASVAGDAIQTRTHQDTGSITLTEGTCPDIAQCTSMHPGAEGTGYWKHTKP
jgi:hypothetical protein